MARKGHRDDFYTLISPVGFGKVGGLCVWAAFRSFLHSFMIWASVLSLKLSALIYCGNNMPLREESSKDRPSGSE